MTATVKFADLEWSIVPGPRELPAAFFPSDQVHHEVVTYAPDDVARVLVGLSGLSVDSDGGGDWWAWRATYEGQRDLFEVNMTLYETQPPMWGGSDLVGIVDAREALDFWKKVATQLPGTYLHGSDACLYSMEGFRTTFIGDPGLES